MTYTDDQLKQIKIVSAPKKITAFDLKNLLGINTLNLGGTADGNGIYTDSGIVPPNVLASITPTGSDLYFGIGVFPDWPTFQLVSPANNSMGMVFEPGNKVHIVASNDDAASSALSVTASDLWLRNVGPVAFDQTRIGFSYGSLNLVAESASAANAYSIIITKDNIKFGGTKANVSEQIHLYIQDGNPEGTQTAPAGSLYIRTDGGAGATLYIKETGAGNTGWAAK